MFTEFIKNEAPATQAYATIKRYNSLYRNHYAERFGSYYIYQISRTIIEDFLNEKRVYLSAEYVIADKHKQHTDQNRNKPDKIKRTVKRIWCEQMATHFDFNFQSDKKHI